MAHLTGFGLENFRVFKDFTWFDFAPITILVGPNNSGKSSLIKALLLAKENNDLLQSNYIGPTSPVLFDSGDHNLSGASLVLNDKSNSDVFSLCIPYSSIYFSEVLIAKFKFKVDTIEKVSVKCGYEIITKDDRILFSKENIHTLYFDIKLLGELIRSDIEFMEHDLFYQMNEIRVHIFSLPNIVKKEINLLENVEKWIEKFNVESEWQKPEDILSDSEYNEIKAFLTCIGVDSKFDSFIIMLLSNNNLIKLSDPVSLNYLPSIKGGQKRMFHGKENDIMNILLKSVRGKKINNELQDFLNKWSKEFTFEGKLTTNRDDSLDANSAKIGDRNLSDLGYGFTQLSALLFKIIDVLGDGIRYNDRLISIESFLGKDESLLIEEPEANLHPKLQSLLADMFSEVYKKFEIHFLIETHSEYMIRKFQYLVAKGELQEKDVVIYYFNDPNNVPADEKQVKKITILEDGSLSDDFGPGFYDEAANWKFELLRLKNNRKN